MKQLEVRIMGESYVLGCPEEGEVRLQQAVARVDTAMCKIRDGGKVRARDRIAVLAAVNLAFDLDNQTPPAPNTFFTPVPTDPQLTSLIAQLDAVLGRNGPRT
ncbi:MAG: cell division protein ZapA [Rhodoferax sp.]|jgi:cell division protein ZapA